mgnify:CR=1 FL=1
MARQVRNIVKNVPILCLEPIDFEDLDIAIKNDITITISSMEYFYKMVSINILYLRNYNVNNLYHQLFL